MAEGIGRTRGGRTSKVHASVDAKGRPFRLEISGGQLHNSQMMDAFLDWEISPLAIVADKAYSSAKIRQQIGDEGALTIIPSKSNAVFQFTMTKTSMLCATLLKGSSAK